MNGKSNIDPKVAEHVRRGEKSREVGQEIKVKLRRLVKGVLKKHPEHESVLMQHLEGEYQRLLSEKEARKRAERT